jgi:hypothetical protein
VRLTGGASVTAGINGGNNTSNITYPGITSKTYYWIGGGGSWNDPAHWAFTSGGPSSNCTPTMYDDVIFNADSVLLGEIIPLMVPQGFRHGT